jgi:hypothetical protein
MAGAIESQEQTAALGAAGESAPVTPEQVDDPKLPDPAEAKEDAEAAIEAPEPVAEPAAVTETASATNVKNQKGGNR